LICIAGEGGERVKSGEMETRRRPEEEIVPEQL
jgi:hypothetical protein